MKRISRLILLDEREGQGKSAQKGDRVVFNSRLFLNKGDGVPLNQKQAEYVPRDQIREKAVWDSLIGL